MAALLAFLALTIPTTPCFAHAYARGPISSTSSSGGSFNYEGGSTQAAFAALDDKRGVDAMRAIAGNNNPLLIDVVTGLAMGQDDSPVDFYTASQFLLTHTTWPESDRNAIARQAEKKMDGSIDPQNTLAFFATYPPQTGDGFMRYVDALNATGQTSKIAAAVRNHWREDSLGEDEQRAFLARFGSSLSGADTFYRLDRLLWGKQYEQAERLYPSLSEGVRALAEARIALSKNSEKAPGLVQSVPQSLQNDPGLLYERTRWRRKHDDMAGAYTLLRQAGNRLGKPDEWWDERNLIIRDLLSTNTYSAAYQVAASHGLTKGQEFSDAEFLAGWISLRFLNNPAIAAKHFQRLNANATAPITFARAAYWLGRATEALGQTDAAQSWFTRASSFGTTYYGQLAAARLYPTSQISALAPAIPSDMVAQFQNQMMPQIVESLAQAGIKKTAERFALAYANNATQENEFRMMAGLALQLNMPDVAVKVAKAAAKKQFVLPVEGYPVLNIISSDIAPLAHAITRQESQFDARISSSSNAQGLMQLLPSTARHVASKAGLSVDPSNLYDPETNVQLGSAYLQELMGNFNSSLPLTIGAYNAGPGRMREWLGKIGDPRGQDVDAAVDWVERIPFNETRNYVQRVMEALQLYRAKLSGGNAILGINRDLTN
ncbi:MAG: lytic transglycosylase domain-containing protein [Alphaproteobacteria bacterium]|nr:lytic transglycosylase domain-containing protein [Alphaproteobacteria bacterium]